jgi:U3 small nucleolar RNA-associated protein 4
MVKPEDSRKRSNRALQDKDWKAKKISKLDTPQRKDSTSKDKQKGKKGKVQNEQEKANESAENTEQNSFKVCKRYQPLLLTEFCQDGSMVVVERPWLNVLETLPPTLQRKRYGKT